MDFGSLELQIFMSLVVVLGAAFIALICDYLKGSNEQLREQNIELLVRRDEQERRALLDPMSWVDHLNVAAAERERPATAGREIEEPEVTQPLVAPAAAGGVSGAPVGRQEAGIQAEKVAPATAPSWDIRETLAAMTGQEGSEEQPPSAEPLKPLELGSEIARVAHEGAVASVPPPAEPAEGPVLVPPEVVPLDLDVELRRVASVSENYLMPAEVSGGQPAGLLDQILAASQPQDLAEQATEDGSAGPAVEQVEAPALLEELQPELEHVFMVGTWAAAVQAGGPVEGVTGYAPVVEPLAQELPTPAAPIPAEETAPPPVSLQEPGPPQELVEPAAEQLPLVAESPESTTPLVEATPEPAQPFEATIPAVEVIPATTEPSEPVALLVDTVPETTAETPQLASISSECVEAMVETPAVVDAKASDELLGEFLSNSYVEMQLSPANGSSYATSVEHLVELSSEDEPQTQGGEQAEVAAEGTAAEAAAPVGQTILMLPSGMHEAPKLNELLANPFPITGLLVVISITDIANLRKSQPRESFDDMMASVDRLMVNLLNSEDCGFRSREDEWILVLQRSDLEAPHRRVSLISEKLWDFQLRSLGLASVLFCWGAVEAEHERLVDAIDAAREQMDQTRKGRRSVNMSYLDSSRKAVNV
jgi:hypothetical protein